MSIHTQKSLIHLLAEYNDQHFQVMMDTGAQKSTMSYKMAVRLGLEFFINEMYQGNVVGTGTAKIRGVIEGLGLKLINMDTSLEKPEEIDVCVNFLVADIEVDMILIGIDFMEMVDSVISINKRTLTVYGKEIRFLNEYQMEKYQGVQNLAKAAEVFVENKVENCPIDVEKNILDTYKSLNKIISNIINNPSDPKYQSVNYKSILKFPECSSMLESFGFVLDESVGKMTITNPDFQLLQDIRQQLLTVQE